MNGGTGTQHPAERTRNQEWRQDALVEAEVEVEVEGKMVVGASCEEV